MVNDFYCEMCGKKLKLEKHYPLFAELFNGNPGLDNDTIQIEVRESEVFKCFDCQYSSGMPVRYRKILSNVILQIRKDKLSHAIKGLKEFGVGISIKLNALNLENPEKILEKQMK